MMTDCAELEMVISPSGDGNWALRFRFWRPGSSAESSLGLAQPARVSFNQEALTALFENPAAYGRALAGQLFADQSAQSAFAQARGIAADRSIPLRLRLVIEPPLPELHALRWEALAAPDDPAGTPLFSDQNLLFSRLLSSDSPLAFSPAEAGRLRALVVIANPSNLGAGLAPIEVASELARARAGLEEVELVELAGGGRATLESLLDQLQERFDILYLVAHGGFLRSQPFLLLERPDGRGRPVEAAELFGKIAALPHLPLLAVLVSCQSAGAGPKENPLVALGPGLARCGVPAVLAMNGQVSFDTMAEFLPVFFRELRRDGQIDRAVAAARGRVSGQPDWWMPVLFSRLRDNCLFRPLPEVAPFEPLHFEPETIFIPGGKFWMGRDPSPLAPAWETPLHEVDLAPYRIALYPVTNRQFGEFIRQTGQPVGLETGWDGQRPPEDRLDYPVTGVTWRQAMEYCRWLSQVTGRAYTLPTEAQWEKAARGPNDWLYPWGDTWQEGQCDPTRVSPVGCFPPQGPYGCFDLVGGVREWTRSLWGEKRSEPAFLYPWKEDGRSDPDASVLIRRVYRGGPAETPAEMTITARGGFAPDKPGPPGKRHGFRVVMLLEKGA